MFASALAKCLICLGGVQNRWEFFINGEGYRQSTDGVDLSKPGEIVVSDDSFDKLCEMLDVTDPKSARACTENSRFKVLQNDQFALHDKTCESVVTAYIASASCERYVRIHATMYSSCCPSRHKPCS